MVGFRNAQRIEMHWILREIPSRGLKNGKRGRRNHRGLKLIREGLDKVVIGED